uniref:Uncharacterized protein n=1 Tax=Moniliophthora roreri TaxID=221103 RepID=A0A0W0GFL7_MONRR
MPVQVVSEDKESKATLPMLFTGEWKNTKKFLLEVEGVIPAFLHAGMTRTVLKEQEDGSTSSR